MGNKPDQVTYIKSQKLKLNKDPNKNKRYDGIAMKNPYFGITYFGML